LSEVVMGRSRHRQAKQRLVPLEADRHVANSNDRPCTSHRLYRTLHQNVPLRV
jgi:hypothetical protein